MLVYNTMCHIFSICVDIEVEFQSKCLSHTVYFWHGLVIQQWLPEGNASRQLLLSSRLYSIVHADEGYSRHGYFGSLLVHSMFLMYLPDDTNVCGSVGGKFEGIGSV